MSPTGPYEDVYDHPFVGGGYGGVGDGVFTTRYLHDLGDVVANYQNCAIDAMVLHAADGSLTLYFSSPTRGGPTVVRAARLADPSLTGAPSVWAHIRL